ncbi:MAG: arylsulfatase [Dehalococcoidales bacterium]|nr:arylsulfatase [Dehalococcoidales bacterium]
MAGSSRDYRGIIRTRYIDSTPWWPEEETADGLPNILFIVLDDMGYADVGCYGSFIETPSIDALAADGLRYRDFHVNAMCSPTRASLLSGCNCHAAGMGFIAEIDMGFPGYRGAVGREYGFLSEALVRKDYATYALGKWHLVPPDARTSAGPFDQWPLGRGFEKFYGFLGAATGQFYPELVCGNEFVSPPKRPEDGYHLSEDLVNRAISYIGDLKSNNPGKPFFCYLAFGALHSPLQAPKEYIERYRGRFNEGWDVYRRMVFGRQKALGIIPADCVLPENDYIAPRWDELTEEEKRVFARYMEVYAGFLTHTDTQIGRLVDYLKKIGQYDNTIIVFLSDNGASAEGGRWGAKNHAYHYVTEKDPPLINEEEMGLLGSADVRAHYPSGWARASNTPLRMYKSWNHCGGVKVPLIITYPKRIKDKGGIRTQYHHVIDIYPTVMELCGIEPPGEINGIPQKPKHGISMVYTFDSPGAPRRRRVQYYEMVGNRAIWADGWKAVADHAANPTLDFSKDRWELYNTDADFSESRDLASQYPDKLRELVDLWWHEAGKYNVLPLAESHLKRMEGFNSKKMYRYRPVKPRTRYVYRPEFIPGPGPRLAQTSYTAKAYVAYRSGDEGVLYAAGETTGGYALYVHDRRLKFHYNWLSYRHFHVESDIELPEGELELGFDFVLTRPGAGVGRLLINGRASGSLYIESESLFLGSPFSIGRFPFVSVTGDMKERQGFPYTNRIDRVEFNLERPLNDLADILELEQALKNE